MIIYETPVKSMSSEKIDRSALLLGGEEWLNVYVTREPYSDFFLLELADGTSHELDVEETKKWFTDRGSDKYILEKVLDHIWNFYKGVVSIKNPVTPAVTAPQKSVLPQI